MNVRLILDESLSNAAYAVAIAFDTLARDENHTLLKVFKAEDHYVADYGYTDDYEKRVERLENLPHSDDTWQASYAGLMTGIAHEYGGRRVWGNVQGLVHFDRFNWVSSVSLSISQIEGSLPGIRLADIKLPTLDGDCCNDRKENGSLAITLFELDRADFYIKGDIFGNAHEAIHGVFSTSELTGGFGALKLDSVNEPPLKAAE